MPKKLNNLNIGQILNGKSITNTGIAENYTKSTVQYIFCAMCQM